MRSRSAALPRVSTPAVPALRWLTLASTRGSEVAAPLCRKVCGKAWIDATRLCAVAAPPCHPRVHWKSMEWPLQ
jgi:hypothetical protein